MSPPAHPPCGAGSGGSSCVWLARPAGGGGRIPVATRVRDLLLDTLKDLEEEELKKFKAKLNEIPVPEGSGNIPRGRLQRADAEDLSHLLRSFYTDAHAVQAAPRVLESIDLWRQAGWLLDAAGILDKGYGCTPVQSSSASTGRDAEPHFIEIHRVQLIQRTSTVEGVVDLLHGSVLDDEQYERVTSWETNQDKMRELCRLLPSWNCSCKDLQGLEG